jgi:hypothetical protein
LQSKDSRELMFGAVVSLYYYFVPWGVKEGHWAPSFSNIIAQFVWETERNGKVDKNKNSA